MIANERIVGVHDNGISRADRVPSPRTNVAPSPRAESTGAALAGICILGNIICNVVIELAVIKHLAPKTGINETANLFEELPVKIGRNGRS